MVYKRLLCLIVSLMATSSDGQSLTGPKHGKVVVCYLVTWGEYRPDTKEYTLEDLDPDLCTHVVYSFAGLNAYGNAIEALHTWRDLDDYGGIGSYKRLVAYKKQYPHLKVLVAMGGWTENTYRYSTMADNSTTRTLLAKSVVEFLTLHQLDGLDLHWKYPTRRDGHRQDKDNFVLLVKELKNTLQPHGFILTVATSAMKFTMDSAYDFLKLNSYVDYFHMLCYDYHGVWDGVVGANAPLKSSKDADFLTVEFTIKYMISHGVSPSKMVLGLAAYGRTYQLMDPRIDRVVFGSTLVQSEAFMGPFTKVEGYMVYNEICLEKMNDSWTEHWHEETMTPYLRDGGRIISYDNPRSIASKVKTAMDFGLGGLMVWSIDTDDFRGACGLEPDVYLDFIKRHKEIADDPELGEALKTLSLENRTLQRNTAYYISEGKLLLNLPEVKYAKYPFMHAVNEAITLALEEKRIIDELSRIITEKDESGSGSMLSSSFLGVLFWLLVGFTNLFVRYDDMIN